jgi:MFS family permease
VNLSLSTSNAIHFLKRQQRDWKITVLRTSLDKLAYQIIFPYVSIYIIALGATATQLGFVNSLGMISAAGLSPLMGWFIDRSGPKKIYLLGIGLLAVSYLTYAIAHSWSMTAIAMVAYWMGYSISTHSCATVCGNCLINEDRATGMTICETVAAGLLGMIGPMIGAWLVTMFGGVSAGGIRPLFFFSLLVTVITFSVIWTQLSDTRWSSASGAPTHLVRDFHSILKEGAYLKRWLVITSVAQLPHSMVLPFSQVYAYSIKGADSFMLGAIVTASALTSIVFSIPLGRLADRLGRKRVLSITIPLFWLSNLALVWSPRPGFLLLAGILQGFYYIGAPIAGAMERELVPPGRMGRWLGMTRFSKMLTNSIMVLVSGVIWDRIGPQYVFLVFIGIDLFLRAPLLVTMPETLRLKTGQAASSLTK